MTAATAQGGLFGGFSRRELALWSGAAFIVASLHAGGGWYLGRSGSESTPPPAAPPAIMLDLPPMVINADTVPLDTADPIDNVSETPQEINEQIDPVEEEVAKPVEEVTEPEPEIEAPKPEVAEEVVPDLVEAPLPEVAMAIPEPRPETEKPKPVVKPVEKKKPVKKKKPEPVEEAKTEKPEKVEKKKPVNSLAQQKAARDGTNIPKAGGSSGTTGSSVTPSQWTSKVGAHILRYRRSVSLGRRGGGDTTVRFTFDSNGTILSVALTRSSGDKALDDAAVTMIRRASPIPTPPPSVTTRFLVLPVGSR